MEHIYCLSVFGLVLFCRNVFCTESTPVSECAPPFIPTNGYIEKTQSPYFEGDEVTYKCKKGFWLIGYDSRTCQKNTTWSGQMPFCDGLLQLTYQRISMDQRSKSPVNNLFDNDLTSCTDLYRAGQALEFPLKSKNITKAIRIYLPPGEYSFGVGVSIQGRVEACSSYTGLLHRPTWLTFPCKGITAVDSVRIQDPYHKSRWWKICEVQAYGHDELSCQDPPEEIPVQHGQVFVHRKIALMKCGADSSKTDTYGICEAGKWKINRNPHCLAEHDEKRPWWKRHKTVIIACCVTIACFFLGCCAVILYIRKKRKNPVVVVVRPMEHAGCSGGPYTCPEEHIYNTIIYDNMTSIPEQRKQSNIAPPPPPLPDLLTAYKLPYHAQQGNTSQNSETSSTYRVPQDALEIHTNSRIIKMSPCYGE